VVPVIVYDTDRQYASIATAAELSQAGFKVVCNIEVTRLSKQFKFADRMGIRVVVVIGPDELANYQVTIKDLSQSKQQTVSRSMAVSLIS
jgi:histidyl-tRNA synthetase